MLHSTTLFRRKPPDSSLPVFSAHSFTRNWQLALPELAEEGNKFCTEECDRREGISGPLAYEAGRLPTELPRPALVIKYRGGGGVN